MLENQKNTIDLPKPLEHLARGLLATTCLTVACGSSGMASTVTLPTSDFPNSAPGILLPVGTTAVNGFAGQEPGEAGEASPDWFEFQGLTPGSSYTLLGVYNPLGRFEESGNGESGLRMSVFTSSNTALFTDLSLETANGVNTGAQAMGSVPSDGKLDVEIFQRLEVFEVPVEEGSRGSYYQVTLTQGAIPEPGTVATMGLGLAGALAWRRRRRQ